MFVDDLDLMAKTKFAVSLTGDNRGTSKYFRWDVDTTSWKPGWNSVEIDVTKGFTKDDGADMSKIRCFVFGAKDSAFAEGDELIVRLDNLRVTGSLDAGAPSNPSNPSTPEDPSSPTENESSAAGDPTGSESENPGTGAATGAAAPYSSDVSNPQLGGGASGGGAASRGAAYNGGAGAAGGVVIEAGA